MKTFLRCAWLFPPGGVFVSWLFIGIALCHPKALAGTEVMPFTATEWHSDHGLPHDSVHAVIQSRDGYLWIGTRRGLVRFDGVQFTVPKLLEGHNESISTLYEDKDGSLWIGTPRGPMRLKDEKLVRFGNKEGIPEDDVRTFFGATDGSIWIGRAGGLSRFKGNTFQNFTVDDGLPHAVVRTVCEDETGSLWIGTDAGLCRMKDGNISKMIPLPEMAASVRIIYVDPQKTLWVGAQTGLFRRVADNQWEHYNKTKNGLSDDFVDALLCDTKGQLWVGTYGGLNRLAHGKFVTEVTPAGTGYDLVNSITEDHEGNIWIGSKEGLAGLKPRPFMAFTKQHGLTYNNVMSVLEDNSGTLWCGTWGGGVFHSKDGRISAFTNELGNNRVLSLCEGRDGSLWFGTDYSTGLFRFKDGSLTHFGAEQGLENIGIRVIYEDRHGTIWIGTARSLARLEDGKFRHYRVADGLAGDAVKVISEDKHGALWVGTNDGLSRWKDGKFTNFMRKDGLSHKTVLALYEDRDDTLWIGTGGGGLCRMRDGRFTAYTTREGLFNDEVLEILEDNHGYLWMSCLKGVFRVSKEALEQFDRGDIFEIPCTSYGKDDGMISVIGSNVAKPAAWKGRDGRLWFATTKGLVVTGPDVEVNDIPPRVLIESVIADKSPIRVGSLQLESEPLRILPGRGEWEIHYTGLSFEAANRNRFRYKLEGVDPDWVDAGTRRVAYYNNIAPGSYTFHVIACNNNGIWNVTGSRLHITFQPHFWQTWWFKSLIAITGLSVTAAVARLVTTKRMQLKLERIEQQHAVERERTRIAKDIHDDLGASLTRITFLGELAEADKTKPESVETYVKKIVVTARDTVRSLDEIVWAVNPRRDTLNSLVEYVAHYSAEFLDGSHLRCRLDLPDYVPEIPLSSEVRHSLFLVIKEFLNNTVKHAQASEVSISMELEDDCFTVELQDDGCGFHPLNHPNGGNGNGVENMRRRIEALGGSFRLDSANGEGTTVSFEVRLTDLTTRPLGGTRQDLELRT